MPICGRARAVGSAHHLASKLEGRHEGPPVRTAPRRHHSRQHRNRKRVQTAASHPRSGRCAGLLCPEQFRSRRARALRRSRRRQDRCGVFRRQGLPPLCLRRDLRKRQRVRVVQLAQPRKRLSPRARQGRLRTVGLQRIPASRKPELRRPQRPGQLADGSAKAVRDSCDV